MNMSIDEASGIFFFELKSLSIEFTHNWLRWIRIFFHEKIRIHKAMIHSNLMYTLPIDLIASFSSIDYRENYVKEKENSSIHLLQKTYPLIR